MLGIKLECGGSEEVDSRLEPKMQHSGASHPENHRLEEPVAKEKGENEEKYQQRYQQDSRKRPHYFPEQISTESKKNAARKRIAAGKSDTSEVRGDYGNPVLRTDSANVRGESSSHWNSLLLLSDAVWESSRSITSSVMSHRPPMRNNDANESDKLAHHCHPAFYSWRSSVAQLAVRSTPQ